MKIWQKIFSIIFVVSLVIACGPVRNSTIKRGKDTSREKIKDVETNITPTIRDNRFLDTTYIKLPDITQNNKKVDNNANSQDNGAYTKIIMAFNNALNDLDNQDYTSAYKKFNNLKSTLDDRDSLYFESDFYMAECLISQNKLIDAKKILDNLETKSDTPSAVSEKVFVRLGQIYCQKNDKKSAAQYFSKLEILNPKSIYLPVANCDFLNKGAK